MKVYEITVKRDTKDEKYILESHFLYTLKGNAKTAFECAMKEMGCKKSFDEIEKFAEGSMEMGCSYKKHGKCYVFNEEMTCEIEIEAYEVEKLPPLEEKLNAPCWEVSDLVKMK